MDAECKREVEKKMVAAAADIRQDTSLTLAGRSLRTGIPQTLTSLLVLLLLLVLVLPLVLLVLLLLILLLLAYV